MKKGSKKTAYLFFLTGLTILFFLIFHKNQNKNNQNFTLEQKIIEFTDENLNFELESKAETVEDFLNEQKITLRESDLVFPSREMKIYSGSSIIIFRAKNITIKEGGKTFKVSTLQNTVEQTIRENKNVVLGEDDITNPSRQSLIKEGMVIVVTHVIIKEEIKKQDIDFKTIANEDDKLSWRTKKVTQKGEKGTKEIKYKVVYHDNKEISRKVLESNVVKNPVEEIVTQGTYVKTGKAHAGLGTWYAWKGGLFAASPWLPMGSYAKVTNKANGKSVIVKINDRGPFGVNRIIDLDKAAFAKIASIGAGVIDVKVEEVLN